MTGAARVSLVVVGNSDPVDPEGELFASVAALPPGEWETIVVVRQGDLVGTESESVRWLVVPAELTPAERMSIGAERAGGRYVAFPSHRSRILPSAPRAISEFLDEHPDTDVLYADELDSDTGSAYLKPAFSPERLRSQDYFGSLVLYRREFLTTIGSVSAGFPGAERYELALRASRSGAAVGHVPVVLSAAAPPEELGAATLAAVSDALGAHLAATGGGRVIAVSPNGTHSTEREVAGEPLVSVIIPSRGDSATIRGETRVLLIEAVRSVIARSTYRNLEFVIVLDTVAPPSIEPELRKLVGDRLRIVPWEASFSFSAKMNLGVVESTGDFLLFLNDDVEVISPGWIEAMLGLAQLPKAGFAGAMLYFEDETIQHAGHAYYRSDVTHIGLGSGRGARGPHDAFLVDREVDGATAACAVMPREPFFDAGGFSTLLPGNFNDVDLCMKLTTLGRTNYWTPRAELYHYESKSRDPRVGLYEIETTWGRWEDHLWDSVYWPDDPHQFYAAD